MTTAAKKAPPVRTKAAAYWREKYVNLRAELEDEANQLRAERTKNLRELARVTKALEVAAPAIEALKGGASLAEFIDQRDLARALLEREREKVAGLSRILKGLLVKARKAKPKIAVLEEEQALLELLGKLL
jgi:hypothetical protein